MKSSKKLLVLFLIFQFLFFSGCKAQNKNSELLPKFINNGPNIIFNQFQKLSENETKSFGDVIFYNVPTRE